LPDGRKIVSAKDGEKSLPVTEVETIDLTGLEGKVRIVAKVSG
jgi:hypothetical protein